MPKRKGDKCEKIRAKIKKLEEKLRRKQRRSSSLNNCSDDSDPTSISHTAQNAPWDYQDSEMVDVVDNSDVTPIIDGVLEQQEPESNPGTSTAILSNDVAAPKLINASLQAAQVQPDTGSYEELLEKAAAEDLGLDSELMDILGIEPTIDKKYGKEIQKDLAIRLQHWTTVGLTKEQRKELNEKYLTPVNSKLIDPPILNAEIKAAVSFTIAKRDKAIENKQANMSSAISCLGEATTLLLSAKEKNTTLLKLLTDAARIFSDCLHADSVTRRNYLICSVKKEIQEQLQNTTIDKLLIGENLSETLKSAKAINKSRTDLRPAGPKLFKNKKLSSSTIQNATPNSARNLNWKGQGPARRPTGPPKTKRPAMTSIHSRQDYSLKPSQHPQQRAGYKRR